MKNQQAGALGWRVLGSAAVALVCILPVHASLAGSATGAQGAGQSAAATAQAEAVFTAVKRDNRSSLLNLIAAGADVNTIGTDGQTPMTLAFQIDSMNAFNALMTSPKTNVEFANRYGETPLMLAAIRGNVDALDRLIRAGAHINREGWTPLHYAASGSSDEQVAIAKKLLDKGADINARSPNGTTPLMMAAGNGTVPVVQLLLDRGADLNVVNEQGMDAKAFAQSSDRAPLVERLQNAKPKPNRQIAPAQGAMQGRNYPPQIPGSWE